MYMYICVAYSRAFVQICKISFQEYVSEGISNPVFYSDLVYKIKRANGAANFVLSSSKTIKRIRSQKYDPVIIESTKGLVLALLPPYTDLSSSIALWQTRWWGLYDRTCPNPLRGDKTLILVPSDCDPRLLQPLDLSSLPDKRNINLLWRMSFKYQFIFLIYYFHHLRCLCNDSFGLSALVDCWSSVFIRRIIYKNCNVCLLITQLKIAVSG